MQPYNPDHDNMTNHEDDNEPLTPAQLAKTWFERVNERALIEAIENDLTF